MSTKSKDDDVGGAERPSEVLGVGGDGIALIARLAVASAAGLGGAGSASADSMELLTQSDRNVVLNDLINQVRPYGAETDQWLRWLNGESFPAQIVLKKPVESLQRGGKVLAGTNGAIARAQKKIDAGKAQLEQGLAELEYQRAVHAATLHWAIVDQLSDMMRGAFAVGPAWTMVRALSGFTPQDTAAVTAMTAAARRDYNFVQEARARDTEMMMIALDFWCGDHDFEESLRFAIKGVVREYQPKEEARAASGVRRRSIKMVRSTMRRTTEPEVVDVLHNLAAE